MRVSKTQLGAEDLYFLQLQIMLSTVNPKSVMKMLGNRNSDLSMAVISSKRRCSKMKESRQLRKIQTVQSLQHSNAKLSKLSVSLEINQNENNLNKNEHCIELSYRDFLSQQKNSTKSTEGTLRNEMLLGDKLCPVQEQILSGLLSVKSAYHPNNAFLYYVNPDVEDKVNSTIRNEAVLNMKFLHTGYFSLSPDTFCKAVNLMDRFIVRVKVKPKYITCVATACYSIASKIAENFSTRPPPDALVDITHCGGNATDLARMELIISSKLDCDVNGVTAVDFLRCILGIGSEKPLPNGISRRLEIVLCSLEVYRYSAQCVALALIYLEKTTRETIPLRMIETIAKFCGVEWCDIRECSAMIQEVYHSTYKKSLPCSRTRMVWTLSRRTLSNIEKWTSSYTSARIPAIQEDAEPDETDFLTDDLSDAGISLSNF